MKKQFRYKKFLIIFGAVIVFFAAVYLAVRAIFPLPPERKMTIEENKIYIASIEYTNNDISSIPTDFALYNDESLVIAVSINNLKDGEIKPYTRIYHVLKNGEILGTFDVDFAVTRIYAFEDGNIGLVNYIQNNEDNSRLFLNEYNSEFELISKAGFPSFVNSSYWLEYSNGLFYLGGSEVTVFDRDLNIKETIPVEDSSRQRLTFAKDNDGNPYLFMLENGTFPNFYPYRYYIRPLSGGEFMPIDVDDKSYYSLIGGGPYPGDSEYPFFG